MPRSISSSNPRSCLSCVIKNQQTLCSTGILENKRWSFFQLRSAILPVSWEQRYLLVKVFELLATLMFGVAHFHRFLHGRCHSLYHWL
ncbi:hypothetical protein DM01DRAFT_1060000 [Hesseltinella vesiculosa]|uniref:Uncharacterized protein n=1 Tax=Hesseltinella vesiculosa TaxID=101127 RepID=A0A1X2GEZ6_9FUNG|nr:hypothetical protein DM01DRAFT_1060000 [Hesseltinella vesiculosa]